MVLVSQILLKPEYVILHQNSATPTLICIHQVIVSGHLMLWFFAYDPQTILIRVCILGSNDDRSTIIYEFIFDLIKLSGGHPRSSLTRSRRSSVKIGGLSSSDQPEIHCTIGDSFSSELFSSWKLDCFLPRSLPGWGCRPRISTSFAWLRSPFSRRWKSRLKNSLKDGVDLDHAK